MGAGGSGCLGGLIVDAGGDESREITAIEISGYVVQTMFAGIATAVRCRTG
jgi:hypothetical protein